MILEACRWQLRLKSFNAQSIEDILRKIVHHEIMWADLTTDRVNRYMQLQYPKSNFFWHYFTKQIDPLGLQIMQYIKDKGESDEGKVNILDELQHDMERIFSRDMKDVGEDAIPADKENIIMIAHSLGSVIAFDYLFGFRDRYKITNLKKKKVTVIVKNFITMGSPIPLFSSAMGHPDSDLTLPPHIEQWLNIYSPRDGIARRMQPFFRNIPLVEKQVSTGFFPLQAHGGYWKDKKTASLIAGEALSALGI